MIPTAIGITFLVFMLIALSPGGLSGGIESVAGSGDAAQRSAERAYLQSRYGLDDPVLVQYARWLGRLSPVRVEDGGVLIGWPDLGVSFARSRPVGEIIAQALPTTLLLNLLSLIVVYGVAVPTGMLAAVKRGTLVDSLIRAALIALWSAPVVAIAVLLQGLFARGGLSWLPPTGLHGPDARDLPFFEYVIDGVRHLVLPVVCLSYGSLALLSRQTRAAVLENLSADHVRTARAKGLPERAVFSRHVVRNSLLPQITMLAAVLPTMLSGSIIVERVFNLPGMGTLLLDSIDSRDREVLMACVLIVSLVNVIALLIADVLYAAADPRVRMR
jgi:ABC-type dipeptide/oligopeptide/nickel transport system permease component